MDLSSTKNSALKQFNAYSLIEKVFLVYILVLILLLIALPLFQTGSLSTTETTRYGFFNPWMIKTNILAILLLWFLLTWNLSSSFKQTVYRLVWFRSNDTFINFLSLFMLVLTFFGMSDVVSVFSNNFSQRVDTTSSFTILLLYLIAGLILTLVIAYSDTQKTVNPTWDINVPSDKDRAEEQAFRKVEEEFGGLFKDQRAPVDTAPTPHTPSASDFVR